ncbi:MAG: hypothetical protein AAGA30_09240 [Planctomycetota bacterium]
MLKTFYYKATFVIAIATTAGCNPDYVDPGEMVVIEGKVFLDQQPVSDARVMFVPDNVSADQDFAISYGTTNSQGEFELKTADEREGALTGKHRVFISKLSKTDSKTDQKTLDPKTTVDAKTAERMQKLKETWEIVEKSVQQTEGESIPHYYNLHSDLSCEVVHGRGIQRLRFDLSSVDPMLTAEQN